MESPKEVLLDLCYLLLCKRSSTNNKWKSSRIIMYTDDTVIYETHDDPAECYIMAQRTVDRLCVWCQRNKLTINIKKTMHMLIPRRTRQVEEVGERSTTILRKNLHNTKTYKYLGVDMDITLSFDAVMDNAYNKPNRKLYILKYIRPYITNHVANLIKII